MDSGRKSHWSLAALLLCAGWAGAAAVIGWAVRKGSPRLVAEGTDFYANFVKKHGIIQARLAQHYKRVTQIKNNAASEELKRFEQTIRLFEQYGAKYGFDPLMLAAQGFQESRLRTEAGERGLDPNQWFNNVELVVAEKIGMEATTYVRNIYKYYVAYKLTQEAHAAARKAREKLERK